MSSDNEVESATGGGGGGGEEEQVVDPEEGVGQPESVERDEDELSADDDLAMQVGDKIDPDDDEDYEDPSKKKKKVKSKRKSKGEKSKKKKKKKKASDSGEDEEFGASVEEETNPEEEDEYGAGKRSKRIRTPKSAPDTPHLEWRRGLLLQRSLNHMDSRM